MDNRVPVVVRMHVECDRCGHTEDDTYEFDVPFAKWQPLAVREESRRGRGSRQAEAARRANESTLTAYCRCCVRFRCIWIGAPHSGHLPSSYASIDTAAAPRGAGGERLPGIPWAGSRLSMPGCPKSWLTTARDPKEPATDVSFRVHRS
jgi:hypothetical protein